ncbi:fibronectin type III domain-containing protein, partial [Enterococcus casseliflavus]|uniref:fibronectin type III domain-containing protein n=1 Tax=Enterococcus casseliflavus TaxID=37734 RepID=UPI003D1274BA
TQTGCSTAVTGTPSAPQSVTATPQPNGRSVLVSWSTPAEQGASAVTGYSVSRLGAADLTTSATSLLISGLEPGTPYTFAVRASNGNGPG